MEQQSQVATQSTDRCPLCAAAALEAFAEDKRRPYLRCCHCALVSVPRAWHLSAAQEKAEYDKHQNDPFDPGYRRFLSRAFAPLADQLPAGAQGLDFGCGPGPALCHMARERGLQMANYDLYYYPDRELLNCQYDFVVLTEVIEHIAQPAQLLQELATLLKPGAILALMTKRVIDRHAFQRWHYKNDPTHICFYALETFEWLAQRYGWQLQVVDADVVFLRAP